MSKADIEYLKDFSKKLELSGAEYSESTLRDIFTQSGLTSDLTERAIKDYKRYREGELSAYSVFTAKEIRELGTGLLVDTVMSLRRGASLLNEILVEYLSFLNYKSQIAETYQKTKDWATVFNTDVYSDVYEAQESFIDYIEEVYQTKIKDIKQLQELTGITHIDSWDEKLEAYKPVGKAEAKENAIRELDLTLTRARYNKFSRAIDNALMEGVKYEDLLQIKPKDYGLPESWVDCLGSDQYTTILWAILRAYGTGGDHTLMLNPSLRSIAKQIEAPYSVVMDSYKLMRW